MRIFVFSFLMLLGDQVWANDSLLKCQFAKEGKLVSFNVSSLISEGCKSQTFKSSTEEFNVRYQISICDGIDAQGVIQVLANTGDWVQVRDFSNQKYGECFLKEEFKPIETNYPCNPNRFGHRGGCQNL